MYTFLRASVIFIYVCVFEVLFICFIFFSSLSQFAAWVDAVIFVFSLENESSFNTVYNYYTKMAHFRNGQEIPMILVGTQDAISERNPRVIDDSRARKLANDLKRCSYYETCATYGLNVERVFQDGKLKNPFKMPPRWAPPLF